MKTWRGTQKFYFHTEVNKWAGLYELFYPIPHSAAVEREAQKGQELKVNLRLKSWAGRDFPNPAAVLAASLGTPDLLRWH